ncbi:sulfotransferase [Methylovulum psychrotolerans]|uniref:SCP2 domain-containing protein n=1 Tax=Methylovulum psychrotolerans TaxID=1704499 RepID=A0A2S5CMG5_9GAMM|nr:sulfotransferase [Methylovulum psychrotolerans]POZ52009.1 hypothetical protein AADEFJLK_02230 [Methylovulum psychrotolerans]
MQETQNNVLNGQDGVGPIFVLSLERSGSTLLRNILDAHPDIFSPAELHIGSLCQFMYETSYSCLSQIATHLSEEDKQAEAKVEVRRVVTELMNGYAAQKNKIFWCDKTTVNINHIDILSSVFPNAKFICLYRNCLDFVSSYLSVSKLGFMEEIAPYIQRNPYNIVSSIVDYWIDNNSAIHAFELDSFQKCFKVTYEQIVSSPDETLDALFAFLGLAWDSQFFERVFSHEGKGPVDGDIKFQFSTKLSTDSIGQGSKIPLTSIPDNQLVRLNNLLVKLGYPALICRQFEEHPTQAPTQNINGDCANPFLADLFANHFPKLIKDRLGTFRALNCVCKLQVNGAESGVWTFDLTKPEGLVHTEDAEAVCTLGVSAEVLKDLVSGKATALEAFQRGLIGASGDRRMAINFGRLLFGQ